MKRKIVSIDEALCNGCELCVKACHEGAIQMVNGKARLVSDQYCDGLGDCLPACPTDAIRIIEREADEYSQDAVDQRLAELKVPAAVITAAAPSPTEPMPCGCPGTMAKKILKPAGGPPILDRKPEPPTAGEIPSQLTQWPVQLKLVNPQADYLKNADILIAADCTAFAYGAFHRDFIQGRITLIGCPKLDDNQFYIEKMAEIFRINAPKSITVVRMEVPCCGGIVTAVKQAMLSSGVIVPYNEVTIGIDGSRK